MASVKIQDSEPEETVFLSVKVKDLPKDVQKRHRFRVKKIYKLNKEESKLREEDNKDIYELLITKRVK